MGRVCIALISLPRRFAGIHRIRAATCRASLISCRFPTSIISFSLSSDSCSYFANGNGRIIQPSLRRKYSPRRLARTTKLTITLPSIRKRSAIVGYFTFEASNFISTGTPPTNCVDDPRLQLPAPPADGSSAVSSACRQVCRCYLLPKTLFFGVERALRTGNLLSR